MSPEQVELQVDRIIAVAVTDPERAHRMEDLLRHELLEAIAQGLVRHPERAAQAALRSSAAPSRWL